MFGWPFETSLGMARIVYGGILEKFPNLKFITHHCGGMVPFFRGRIGEDEKPNLSKSGAEYFKMFYADTAIKGNAPALMCAADFFSTGHLLFGTDFPFGRNYGEINIIEVIKAIEQMSITEQERKNIFEYNARKLLLLQP
jgi:uncharacterized protein